MNERQPVAGRFLPWAPAILAAALAVGCVAAPGSSAGPGGSTRPSPNPSAPPSSSPSAQPSVGASTSPPSPSDSTGPGTSPSAVPPASASPSKPDCGVATWAKGANDLVLRVTVSGGFVAPGVDQTSVPVISVYGDGRVISEGPQIMIYPGPLLPSLQVQVLDETGMRRLLNAAAAAGLLVPDVTYEQHTVADAPTSFFTLAADGCTHHVNAQALIESDSTAGLDQATIDARAKLLKFRTALMDLPTLVGKDNVADGGVYEPTAYRIVAREEPAGTGAPASPVTAVTWPLATPLTKFGAPLGAGIADVRCGVAAAAEAQALKPLFEKANAETQWSSAGRSYSLRVRPLLPDESGCDAPLV